MFPLQDAIIGVSLAECLNCSQNEADTTSFSWPAVQVAMGTRWGLSADYCSGDHTWLICIQFKLGKIQKKKKGV